MSLQLIQIDKAIELLEHTVGIQDKLAEDHPARLASQHDLALAYREYEQVNKTIELLENRVDIPFITFQRLAWCSLTRGRVPTPLTHPVQSYHTSRSQRHSAILASLLRPPQLLPAPAPSLMKRRTLDFCEAPVSSWNRT